MIDPSAIREHFKHYTDDMEAAYSQLPPAMKAEGDRVAAELRELSRELDLDIDEDWWKIWTLASFIFQQAGVSLSGEDEAVAVLLSWFGTFHRVVGYVGYREAGK